MVLAIDLSGDAAAGSFRSSLETLTGDSNLEVTATGGIPENVLATLATLPEPIRVRARIEDYVSLAESGKVVPLLGVDVVAESNDSNDHDRGKQVGDVPPADFLDGERAVFVGSSSGLKTGSTLNVLVNDQVCSFTVRGVFDDAQDDSNALVMDIGAAQKLLRREGRVDRILVKVPESVPLAEWQKTLAQHLPEGISIAAQGTGTDENRKMLAAFRWNLKLLSYIALVVGAFLIYNTISVSVVRRRPEIGILRALGASRAAVMGAFLAEAVTFGIVGSALGIPLGRAMAAGAVRLLAGTVDSLYVTSQPGSITLTLGSYLLALAIGLSVSIFSALSPAREASLVPPIEAMANARREITARVHKGRDFAIAIAMAVCGGVAAYFPRFLVNRFLGIFPLSC